MASLYFNEDLHPDAFTLGARLPIWGADARHAAQVARVRTGERIGIGDGAGRLAWGGIVHVAQGEVAIVADEIVVETPLRPRIVLVQALAKGDRDELAIQVATELGVAVVQPWQASRSVSVWKGDKVAKGLERWKSVVREASKQAIRPTVPSVGAFLSTRDLASALRSAGDASTSLALILEPSAQDSIASLPRTTLVALDSLTLIVGPEGGIAPEELRELELAGARPVRLGAEVLRTSTAGPAAVAALSVVLGRW